MSEFHVLIEGRPVSYLKRVRYGAPYVLFAGEGETPAKYQERIAKGWFNTCKQYWDDVRLEPVAAKGSK